MFWLLNHSTGKTHSSNKCWKKSVFQWGVFLCTWWSRRLRSAKLFPLGKLVLWIFFNDFSPPQHSSSILWWWLETEINLDWFQFEFLQKCISKDKIHAFPVKDIWMYFSNSCKQVSNWWLCSYMCTMKTCIRIP